MAMARNRYRMLCLWLLFLNGLRFGNSECQGGACSSSSHSVLQRNLDKSALSSSTQTAVQGTGLDVQGQGSDSQVASLLHTLVHQAEEDELERQQDKLERQQLKDKLVEDKAERQQLTDKLLEKDEEIKSLLRQQSGKVQRAVTPQDFLDEPFEDDSLPAWATKKIPRLSGKQAERCQKRLALPEEMHRATNLTHDMPVRELLTQVVAHKKHESDVVVREFKHGHVKQQYCKASSLACAGCVNYDATRDVCQRCDEGFSRKGGTSVQCQACSDVPDWADPQGHTCKDYENVKWCAMGKVMKQSKKQKGDLHLMISNGLSPIGACCACGGGSVGVMPFEYPVNTKPLVLGKPLKEQFPSPRTATEYTVDGCNLHALNLTFDWRTGAVSGSISASEATEVSCSVTAHDSHHGLKNTAPLKLIFRDIAYPSEILFASHGATWSPEFAGHFSNFTVECTPHLTWLAIHAKTGRLHVQGHEANLQPRMAGCTVSAMKMWCPKNIEMKAPKPGETSLWQKMATNASSSPSNVHAVSQKVENLSSQSGCTSEKRQVELVIMVPQEAKSIYLTHRDNPSEKLHSMMLTVNEDVPSYQLVPALTKAELQLLEAPGPYVVACSGGTTFDRFTSSLKLGGVDVFSVGLDGTIKGTPGAGLMKHCSGSAPRCKLLLSCTAYAELRITNGLVNTSFDVSIYDDTCWQSLGSNSPGWQQLKVPHGHLRDLASCRHWCRSSSTCAAFSFADGRCTPVRRAASVGVNASDAIHIKVRGCSIFSRCLDVKVPGAAYLSGEYCPDKVRDSGWPLFSKPGAIESASIRLQRYVAKREWENPLPCPAKDRWILRRQSKKDLIKASEDGKKAALVELYGDVVACISTDILTTAYEGSGNASIAAKPSVLALDRTSATASLSVSVDDCVSPLIEREEELKALGVKNEFEDPDEAKAVFLFDDPSTTLAFDYSLGPCECPSEEYGDSFPTEGLADAMPPGSGNQFIPAPQLLASGSIACLGKHIKSYFTLVPGTDCQIKAMQEKAGAYWTGEISGVEVCRLYTKCDVLVAEHGTEGQLYGVSKAKACVVANPDKCWAMEKRRQFMTGYKSVVPSGSDGSTDSPCLYENTLRACDSFKIAGVPGISECGRCLFKSSVPSRRLPMPGAFASGSQLLVSCHPDYWRGMPRGGSSLLDSGRLTCVDGRWIDDGGYESMARLTCEAGVRITSKHGAGLVAKQAAGNAEAWWEDHFGKTIQNWDGSKCLSVRPETMKADVEFPADIFTSPSLLATDATAHPEDFNHSLMSRENDAPDDEADVVTDVMDAPNEAVTRNVFEDEISSREIAQRVLLSAGESSGTYDNASIPYESLMQTNTSGSRRRLYIWAQPTSCKTGYAPVRESGCNNWVSPDIIETHHMKSDRTVHVQCETWYGVQGCNVYKFETWRIFWSTCQTNVLTKYGSHHHGICELECNVGEMKDQSRNCVKCPAGKYYKKAEDNKFTGKEAYCENCEAGKYSNQNGQTKCDVCEVGKYSSQGQSRCDDCPKNKFQEKKGQAACEWCEAGKHSDVFRSTTCKPCQAGRYSPRKAGNVGCIQCQLGRHASLSGSTSCKRCPINTFSADKGSRNCAACSLGEFAAEIGSSKCTSCSRPGQYLLSLNTNICRDCPCFGGFKCRCSAVGGFSWQLRVDKEYIVKVTLHMFKGKADKCFLNGQSFAADPTVAFLERSLMLTPGIGLELRGACDAKRVEVSSVKRPGFYDCDPQRDKWSIEPIMHAPGRSLFKFLGMDATQCVTVAGDMRECSANDHEQLVAQESLVTAISEWTFSDASQRINRNKDFTTKGGSSKNVMEFLADADTVGSSDDLQPRFLSAVYFNEQQSRYWYTFKSVHAAYRKETCASQSTVCQEVDEGLASLEAHPVACKEGMALQKFEMTKCSAGYQYTFTCCQAYSLGGCTASFSPWTLVNESFHPLHELTKQSLECPSHSILHAFVLEAKNPGKTKEEIRYDIECCAVDAALPVAIVSDTKSLTHAFKDFEGIYFPTKKNEGVLEFAQNFHYTTGVSYQSVLEFSKYDGKWCLKTPRRPAQHSLAMVSAVATSSAEAFAASFVERDLRGTDVRRTQVSGSSDALLDAACCQNCNNEPQCEFWVREAGSSGSKPCWLKRGATTYKTDSMRRGAVKACVAVEPTLTSSVMQTLCGHDAAYDEDRSPAAVGCNAADTVAVRYALANGMFGGASGSKRNCGSWCLYDVSAPSTVAWYWSPGAGHSSPGCWGRNQAECRRSWELTYAKDRASKFCQTTTTTTEACVAVEPTLTSSVMQTLCGHHAAYDEDRSPAAVGCNTADTVAVRYALANGMFGGASGSKRNCGSWCLYDVSAPVTVAWYWSQGAGCWGRNQAHCRSSWELTYATDRASKFCKAGFGYMVSIAVVDSMFTHTYA